MMTTNPPIIKIVEMLFIILFPNISPIEENETLFFFSILYVAELSFFLSKKGKSFFDLSEKKPKIIPTLIQA